MAGRKRKVPAKKEVKRYVHSKTKRTNNPPAGLASQTSSTVQRQKYSFDPRFDPQLHWSSKQETSSFELDTVPIHIHERIDPSTILYKVKKQETSSRMDEFFDTTVNNPPLTKALEFYEHEHDWSNRMIAGDSSLIMNSLLKKENMAGKVQMIYFDPPYGINYSSNFQPYVNQTSVKDGKDEDLTSEPEMIKAFRDTWELRLHSFLSHIRERLLLARHLLTDSGSIFVQISLEHVHRIKIIMDEIFGSDNFVTMITFRRKPNAMGAKLMGSVSDYLVWYAKDKKQIKHHKLFEERYLELGEIWNSIELSDNIRRRLTKNEIENQKLIPPMSKIFRIYKLSPSVFSKNNTFTITYKGKKYLPPYTGGGRSWKLTEKGMKTLVKKDRVWPSGDTLGFIGYWNDFPYVEIDNLWNKLSGTPDKRYVVETSPNTIQRCILMTTDPGDLVFDPTCGSGTTAYVSEKYGRRWITCDTSRVALNLAQRRLMTSVFDYYELAHPKEGVCSGFKHNVATHITMGSLANNEPPDKEILYDQPHIDNSKKRISGPFTIEAIPSPVGKSVEELYEEFEDTISEQYTTFQQEWSDEILKTGIRLKGNQKIEFADINTSRDTNWINCIGHTNEEKSKTVAISFGPPYSPLSQKQVEYALQEANDLVPKPDILIFAAMQFDPEALKNIRQVKWHGVTILSVDINKDLLVKDLKKRQKSSESFLAIGQPDVELEKQKDDSYIVRVKGFDYYNTKTNQIVSGDTSSIAMWLLDTDYDERSIYPEQVFLTMDVAGSKNEIKKLAKTLHAEIDPDLIQNYTGFESLPFIAKSKQRIAVKIIDNKGVAIPYTMIVK